MLKFDSQLKVLHCNRLERLERSSRIVLYQSLAESDNPISNFRSKRFTEGCKRETILVKLVNNRKISKKAAGNHIECSTRIADHNGFQVKVKSL